MTRTRMSIWWLPVILVLCVGLSLAIALPWNAHDRNQCEARGGHLGPKSLCLTPDGRVIE
jgi:hypothetical protein